MAAEDRYRPVACGIYDMLEAAVVRRSPAVLLYYDHAGKESRYTGRILDVFARGSEEFVKLEGGEELRLDRIRSLDGVANDRCVLR